MGSLLVIRVGKLCCLEQGGRGHICSSRRRWWYNVVIWNGEYVDIRHGLDAGDSYQRGRGRWSLPKPLGVNDIIFRLLFRSSEAGVTILPQARQELLYRVLRDAMQPYYLGQSRSPKAADPTTIIKYCTLSLASIHGTLNPDWHFTKASRTLKTRLQLHKPYRLQDTCMPIRLRISPGAACALMMPSEHLAP